MIRAISILSLSLMLLPWLSGGVSAHADVLRSSPEAKSIVTKAPAQLDIWFDEEIDKGSTADVIGPDGKSVADAPAEIDLYDPDRAHLIVKLKPNLKNGTYTVAWTSVSTEDGDTESGKIQFTIEAGTPIASPVASPQASPIPVASPAASSSPVAMIFAQSAPPAESDIPTGDFLIAIGVGVMAALFIFFFWLLVKPRGDEKKQG